MYKRRLINYIVLFAFIWSMVGATLPAPVEGAAYTDIAKHWAKIDIEFVSGQGIISGYGDGTFKPDRSVTRAEFASMINHTFNLTAQMANSYSDVKSSDWFAADIGKATAAGYMSGYGNGTVRPNAYVSRQEAASMIARVLGLNSNGQYATINSYKDKSSIGAWSKDACAAVVTAGYMNGYPDNTFRPGNYIKRCEAAVIMRAVYGLKPGTNPATPITPETPVTPVTPESPDEYDQAGTYGPSSGEETVSGDLTLSASGITLRNTYIKGDLTIASSVGSGSVTLKGVRVKGKLYVNGGGSNSVNIDGGTIPDLIVDKEGVRVVASGSATITDTTLQSAATLYEGSLSGTGAGFDSVTVSSSTRSGSDIVLKGKFDSVKVSARVDISISSGSSVSTLTIDAASATVSGSGTITTAYINAEGVVIAQSPNTTIVAKGLTASVNGETVKGSGTTNDTTPPKFLSGYPDTNNVKDTYLDLAVKIDEDGSVYWVVLDNSDEKPTSTQVKAGKDADNDAVASSKRGSVSVTKSTEKSTRISNLTKNQTYSIYIVAEDKNGNLQSSATRLVVTMNATDSAIPKFEAGYPKKVDVNATTAEFQVKIDDRGYCYYVVLKSSETAPTAAQVKAGKNSSGVLQAAGQRGFITLNEDEVKSITFTSLTANTSYTLYAITADIWDSTSTTVTKVAFTTLASSDTGTIAFSAPTKSVGENDGSVTLTVNRTGGTTGTARVHYATAHGSATEGSDYTAASGDLTFAGATTSQTITIVVKDDSIVEINETFTVTLSSVSGAALSANKIATVTITNDDVESAGVIKLDQSSFTVNESDGSVSVQLLRTGGSSGEATIEYETSDGTAEAGNDYTTASGSWTWANGNSTSKTITIPINNDGDNEPSETFTFRLQNPTGATLGSPSTATITINDDDLCNVGPSDSNYVVTEGGTAVITLTRSGGTAGAVTVNYHTANGSAVADTNYTAASGSVMWADGESGDKTISVNTLVDAAAAGDVAFNVVFDTDDANLSAPSCMVTIQKS